MKNRYANVSKPLLWISLVAIPVLYELARGISDPIIMLLLLHWSLTTGILIRVSKNHHVLRGFDLRNAIIRFVLLLVVISAYCTLLIIFFGSKELAGWQYAQIHFGIGRWGVIISAISAGFCEEIIFRGYMITGLIRAKQRVVVAIVLSTLSFVFMHGVIPLPFFVVFFMLGLIFALIYYFTSNLWWSIFVHALWDASVLLIPMA